MNIGEVKCKVGAAFYGVPDGLVAMVRVPGSANVQSEETRRRKSIKCHLQRIIKSCSISSLSSRKPNLFESSST